ncbi:nhl repeat-containing protein 2-like [Plakobranchus ocellatus]|uniref:Nhl repeat-containing protein 2-like n=1 Tax=Plakobranchus ocellatus TaxID=259542 RepID=A0AAV4C2K7_9GAST|nr:nhl repeat-containing protein 2-like [Plakobranchus ocellatus]
MNYSIYDVLGIINDFDEALSSHDTKSAIKNHLQYMDKINFSVRNFPKGLDWLNVSEELSLDNQLKGKLVILDFFTYCCINCMHILPDLEAVEEQFPPSTGVAVVGVHSAKFLNEKVTANIISAILRYNIHHPVINDKNAELWQELAVSCWPTLLFIGPSGQLLYSVAGEGHREKVKEFLSVAVEYYADILNKSELPVKLERDKVPSFNLSFPGKVCHWSAKQWLVISDTGNHRIVVTDLQGIVKHVIGSGHMGFQDGAFESARFSSPQGVVCSKANIFVADTGNHALRQIIFEGDQAKVITLAGTGFQGNDKEGGKTYTDQELSSPWDVLVSKTPEGSAPVLFIAMGGMHQIWVFFLSDGCWYKGKSYPIGTCIRFAGSGLEENRNNSYPDKAGFAQPSGLAISQHVLYVADSESSSIRSVSLDSCKVAGVVGGERDPTNLFAFGDCDGKGYDAKLQHPLGVTVVNDNLIIADSYNHKIKYVDLNTKECHTLAGNGSPGAVIDPYDLKLCQFNEPGGLSADHEKKLIYIADTNNHTIKVLDFVKKSIYQLPIIFPEEADVQVEALTMDEDTQGKKKAGITLPAVTARVSEQETVLHVPVELPDGHHFNTDAPNSWKITPSDDPAEKFMNLLPPGDKKGDLKIDSKSKSSVTLNLKWPKEVTPNTLTLNLEVQVFMCMDDEDICLPPKTLFFIQTIHLI